MARKFLTAIDLSKNELQNAVVQNLGAAPSTPVKGQLYFDSTGNVLYWWNGTAWVAAQGGAGVAYGSVPAETTFGLARADGVATTVARSDHTHGSPAHSAAEHSTIPISALAAATANVNMGSFQITSLGSPSVANDAANKAYVDNAIAGLSWKEAVRVATTANITLSGLQTIDGASVTATQRVLVKSQSNPIENGIYSAASGAWSRTADGDTVGDLEGAAVYVIEGTTMGDTSWSCTTDGAITPGTTANVWAQFAGGGAVTAGAGMTQSGNTLNVIGDASITVATDLISRAALTGDVTAAAGDNATTIAADAVTNTKLANMPLGSIKGNDTGVAADPKDLTVAQTKVMLGYVGRYSAPCAGALTTVANHGFNTRIVQVEVWRTTTPWDTVDCDVERTDANNVTVRFAVAPTAGEYTIGVFG